MAIKFIHEAPHDYAAPDSVERIEMRLSEESSLTDALDGFKRFLLAVGYSINGDLEIISPDAPPPMDEYYDEEHTVHMGELQLNPEKFTDKSGHAGFGFYRQPDDQPVDKLVQAYDKMQDPDYVGREYEIYNKGCGCNSCLEGECK